MPNPVTEARLMLKAAHLYSAKMRDVVNQEHIKNVIMPRSYNQIIRHLKKNVDIFAINLALIRQDDPLSAAIDDSCQIVASMKNKSSNHKPSK